jgi:Domain of unknown function (DUF6799)
MNTMNPRLLTLPLTAFFSAVVLSSCETTTGTGLNEDAGSQGTMVANSRQNSSGHSGSAAEIAGDPEGVARVNGTLFYVKDLRGTRLSGRQRFANGAHLEANGDVILNDGRRVRLREGEMVTLSGDVREVPRALEVPR